MSSPESFNTMVADFFFILLLLLEMTKLSPTGFLFYKNLLDYENQSFTSLLSQTSGRSIVFGPAFFKIRFRC